MKKKLLPKIGFVILSLVFVLSTCMVVMAKTAPVTGTQDGLVATLDCDKDEYLAGETVKVTLNVKNNNSYAVNDVKTQIILPNEIKVTSGNLTQEKFTLAANSEKTTEELSFTKTAVTEKQEEKTDSPKTGDSSHIGIYITLMVLSGTGLVILVLKKKKLNKVMSLVLCFALLGTAMITPVVNAASSEKTFTVEKSIKYANEDMVIKANISYAYVNYSNVTVTNGTGTGLYEEGATVSITAEDAEVGKHFTNWTVTKGNVTLKDKTSVTTTFVMGTEDVEIKAEYAVNTYTIEVTSGENGKVSPEGQVVVNYGENQTFTITPNTGYHIASVEVDGVNKGVIDTFTFNSVKENHKVKATFAIDTFEITSTANVGGTITETTTVDYGSSKTFTITPNAHYHIEDVKVDGASVGKVSSYEFTNVTASHKIEVTFAIDTFTIEVTSGENGKVSPAGNVSVEYGKGQIFTVTANEGYHIDNIEIDGQKQNNLIGVGNVWKNETIRFTDVKENHKVKVAFAIDTFTITSSAGANGTITETATVDYGSSKTFTITPNAHYHVADVKVDGASVGAKTSYEFTNVTETHTIDVTFAIDTFTITSSANAGGTITETATVDYGGSKTFTITPNAHYHIADVKVDGASVGAKTSYEFTNITATHTIDVTFAIDTFTITSSAGANGTITSTASVGYGSSKTFTMTANSGYGVKDVKVDGTSVGPVTSYTFDDVKETHTIEVEFDTATIVTDATSFRNAVKQNGIIVLANDIILDDNGDVQIDKDLILHGNGHQIDLAFYKGSDWQHTIYIRLLSGSHVETENCNFSGSGFFQIQAGAELEVYGGNFKYLVNSGALRMFSGTVTNSLGLEINTVLTELYDVSVGKETDMNWSQLLGTLNISGKNFCDICSIRGGTFYFDPTYYLDTSKYVATKTKDAEGVDIWVVTAR